MFLIGPMRLAVAWVSLVCAANVVAATATEHINEIHTAVVLDFSSPMPEYLWEELRTELERTQIAEVLNRKILWMKREQFQKGMNFPEMFQATIQGHCVFIEQGDDAPSGPLGWVYLAADQIQPFAFANCTRIAYLLAPAMRGRPRKEQQNKMARALARVIAHELTHILTQNRRHSASGLQKACLTQAELLRDDLP